MAVSTAPTKQKAAKPTAARDAPKRSISTPPTSESGILGRPIIALSSPIWDWLSPRWVRSIVATGATESKA